MGCCASSPAAAGKRSHMRSGADECSDDYSIPETTPRPTIANLEAPRDSEHWAQIEEILADYEGLSSYEVNARKGSIHVEGNIDVFDLSEELQKVEPKVELMNMKFEKAREHPKVEKARDGEH